VARMADEVPEKPKECPLEISERILISTQYSISFLFKKSLIKSSILNSSLLTLEYSYFSNFLLSKSKKITSLKAILLSFLFCNQT